MNPTAASVPAEFRPLFWDVNPDTLDPRAWPDYVLERVLELGTPEAYRWARGLFGEDRIREFLRSSGPRHLSPRALNFWALLLDIEDRECLVTRCLENKWPLWVS
jgi:hypothetical protein